MTLGLFAGGPGFWELIIILFVILLLFGSRKLPDLARSLGRSLGEFKKGRAEGEKELPGRSDSDSEKDQSTGG